MTNYWLLKEGTRIKRWNGNEWTLFVTTKFAIYTSEDIESRYESASAIGGEILSSRSFLRRKVQIKIPNKSFTRILVHDSDLQAVSHRNHFAVPR